MSDLAHLYYLQVPLPRTLYDALKALAAAQQVSLRDMVHALLAQAVASPPADLRAWQYTRRVGGRGASRPYQPPGTTPEAFPVESLPSVPLTARQALPEEPGLLLVLGEAPRAVLYIASALSLRHYQPRYVTRATAGQATRMAWLVLPVEHLLEARRVWRAALRPVYNRPLAGNSRGTRRAAAGPEALPAAPAPH